jgi:hypothetical protein
LIELREKIKEGLQSDPTTRNIMKQVKEGKTKTFWTSDGLLYFDKWIFIPKMSHLRKKLMKECYYLPCAGHPGPWRMLELLEEGTTWSGCDMM